MFKAETTNRGVNTTSGDICIINISDSQKWNDIVTSFKDYDVYYLSNYAKAFQIHGDGEPLLFYYESNALRVINVFMKRDIALFPQLKDMIEPGSYYDIVTPYGYGGFLFEGDTSENSIMEFYGVYLDYMKMEHLISGFRRYHPQLGNANTMRNVSEVIDLGKTISMDLNSTDLIDQNLSKQNRNRIRWAKESKIVIHHGKGLHLLYDFMKIYNATMDYVCADPYYYFKKEFYESIHLDLHDQYEVFYAVLDEKTIASSIMIYANNRMHCHLLGSSFEYRNLAPSNLLIYEAACWGYEKGFKTMHLGGGLGSTEDNLLQFKKTFNRHSDNTFSIGSEIFNPEIYDKLVELRRISNPTFNGNSTFFPLYRAI